MFASMFDRCIIALAWQMHKRQADGRRASMAPRVAL